MQKFVYVFILIIVCVVNASPWQGLDEGFSVIFSNEDSIRLSWSSSNVNVAYIRYLQRENPDIDEWNASTWIAIPRGKIAQLQTVANFPSNGTVYLGDPVCFRDLWMVPLSIQLLSPTIAEGNVTFGTISIRFVNSTFAPQPLTRGVSSYFLPIYTTLVPNFFDVYPTANITLPPKVIAITTSNLVNSLTGWVNWRKKLGWNVQVVPLSSIGSTAQSIRNWLLTQYNSSQPPDAVFLVGDETQIPTYYSNTSDPTTIFSSESYPGNYIDEHFYARLEGPLWQNHPDPMPDLLIGRMTVANPTEVLTQANKIVSYESNPDQSNWYNYGVVASDQQTITQINTKRWTRQRMLENGYLAVDSLFTAGSGTLLNGYLNQGRSLLNYRGSGWAFGWAGIGYYYTYISQVDNVNKPVVITGMGCGVGKFDEPNCFGEAWMRQGSISVSKGSVGFIGPTWNTHTQFNNTMDVGLYRMWFRSYLNGLASGLIGADAQVLSSFAAYSPQDSNIREVLKTQISEYVCLSDPLLNVHLGRPDSIVVTAPSMLTVGTQNVTIHVTNVNQQPRIQQFVTIYDTSGINLGSGWTNAQGNANFTINIPNHLTVVGIAVSGYKSRVYRSLIPVNQNLLFVSIDSLIVRDSIGIIDAHLSPGETANLSVKITNISQVNGTNLQFLAVSSSQELNLLYNQVNIPFLSPNDSIRIEFPVVLSPQYRGNSILRLTITGFFNNDTIAYTTLEIPTHYPTIQIENVLIDTTGNFRLDRGETVPLQFILSNDNQLDIYQLQVNLSTNEGYISVTPNTLNFDTLLRNSVVVPIVPLSITGSDTLPAYFPAQMQFIVSVSFPTWVFIDTLRYHFLAGTIDSTAPSYTPNQPYYAYESDDTLYTESLEFDWLDIAPRNGGNGNLVNFTNGNQVLEVALPFSFRYFGQVYQSVSVSTDGWVAPGRQLQPSWLNQFLPNGNDSILGMICPWWDNLWGFSQSGQSCYTFYDTLNHLFIIQWDSVTVGANGGNRLNFQMIIYDENFYPTITGDNAFDFVYKSFQGEIVYSMTVGIESPDETIALMLAYHLNRDSTLHRFHNQKRIHFTPNLPRIRSFTNVKSNGHHRLNALQTIPTSFDIVSIFPNPFNAETNILLSLPWNQKVRLDIYNVLGRKVHTVFEGDLIQGYHQFSISSIQFGSGMYYLIAETSRQRIVKKLMLVK
ncbi:MAG: C25 family cysteine peptidase [bacterium]|nr:C25 family cysteine peptidase [bacterium]